MASDGELSELSSLSSLSPVPSDDELDEVSDSGASKSKGGILKFFPKLSEQPPREPSPPPRKRSPSPPHEYVLADNPDIAFIVMFRSRFNDVFPKSLAHFGPQELERDVVEPIPGDRVEHFLCALLGLILNRKQDVKPGHYGRALEDALSSHKNQWPRAWNDKNPLSGGGSFNSMTPTERLTLLRTLVLWCMSSSETVKTTINQSYKGNRHEDDMNQPRAVQPWGADAERRRYFLIEGQDDTAFRVYRESNATGTNRTWFSVAGSIDDLKALSEKLETKYGGPKAKRLSQKIMGAIPRFEAGDEKRKRREYRQMRKEQFKRPEPGFSLYEGRTRGKRIKYTYSDDEDIFYSDSTNRRSARNTGTHTPAESGPLTTASGRQIKAPMRLNVATGDSAPGSVQGDHSDYDRENSVGPGGRPRRSAAVNSGLNGFGEPEGRSRRTTTVDSDAEESEADFGDDEDDVDAHVPDESEEEDDFDEDEAMVDDDLELEPQSLVVKLSVTPPKLRTVLTEIDGAFTNVQPLDQPEELKPNVGAVSQGAQVENTTAGADEVSLNTAPKAELMDTDSPGAPLPTPVFSMPAREKTPEPVQQAKDVQITNTTPLPLSPLAFRGSPEKPLDQLANRTTNMGLGGPDSGN